MIKLSKTTHAKINRSVEQVGLCEQALHHPYECHMCRRNSRTLLRLIREGSKLKWCLCEHHKREVGVLW